MISVVVPTRNRPDALARCLDALAHSFPTDAETIVVSDGGSPLDLEHWADSLRLRLIVTPHRGPAAARNRGLAAARGDVVAFTDDDCAPRPGWVAGLSAGVAPDTAAGGTTVNGSPQNPYADASQLILELVGRNARDVAGEERFFSTTNAAFPVDALRRLGGFDESFRTAEDRELFRRWRSAGLHLCRVPTAVVEHHPELDFTGFLGKFYEYGRGARQFHGGPAASSAERDAVLRFHLGLPRALRPELRGRGVVGGARLLALVALWEMSNLAGFVTGPQRHREDAAGELSEAMSRG